MDKIWDFLLTFTIQVKPVFPLLGGNKQKYQVLPVIHMAFKICFTNKIL